MENYTSSIINNFGDPSNVQKDAKTLTEILSRQGITFFLEIIADNCGNIANAYKLPSDERAILKDNILEELSDLIEERI